MHYCTIVMYVICIVLTLVYSPTLNGKCIVLETENYCHAVNTLNLVPGPKYVSPYSTCGTLLYCEAQKKDTKEEFNFHILARCTSSLQRVYSDTIKVT